MPQRRPGKPSLDRLMHKMVLSFQNGSMSSKMIFGNGTP
ncbi:Uncharacterised protein [Vibrio cholerae]|nr:Uncharacterised protein [Vibrio cholerae]CSI43421.1 Uncharacterised protein [Vibrio cholerae]CSI55182.1 Uncharacterised protein [Vibrio cholerae]